MLSDLSLTALDQTPLDVDLSGKVVLFVNVASKCGLTPQYTALQALATELRDAGLVVIGVPCNQFKGQEPGTAEEIATFCAVNYGVDFPLLEKQDVNGDNRSPLYTWLVGDGEDIEWNFGKFLVGRDGQTIQRFHPKTEPDSDELREAILTALG